MTDYTPAMPHGPLEEIFPDVFLVTGTTRPVFEGRQWQFSRNMIVVRHGLELTLVNTVRLDEDGLAELEELGEVKHVVKLGAFHGFDDAFYVDTYGAKLWGLPGAVHESGKASDADLTPGGPTPFPCRVFLFETANMPEGLLLIEREGGILISCDSLQNWAEPDAYFDEPSAAMMREAGFIRPANVGPGWRRFAEPERSDFERLRALPFAHLLPAHGAPLLHDAHGKLGATFDTLFSG